ncbi:MAG TPA: hypothetical protein ENG74_01670 [Thermoplasmatales archaeon]|nr:hypothetical protein [Thermoplasmatales archaeon]
MREYKIKRGHNPDINKLLEEYFGVKGDIDKGFSFVAEGIGEIFIRKEGSSLFIETKPSRTKCKDFSIIKKWNEFLYKATGKTAKERKRELTKL